MIVWTKYGKIEGITERGCSVFKGVPYAKPPVGALRFRKPQPCETWDGVYRADHFRCKSMQGPGRGGFYQKEFYSNPEFSTEPGEDSLYLNIWAPQAHSSEKYPVAVYVHGGAFMSGAGSNLPFVCDQLVRAGVIVVTINYRLGAFGFLCHPILGVEGENKAGGNFGLWDQIAALAWVKENIEAFGGDSRNITAFGQSAGAMSLQALAVSPKAEGLFDRMILQSGGGCRNPLQEYRTIESAADTTEELLNALGIPHKEWAENPAVRAAALQALQQTSAQKLMEAVDQVMGKAFAQKRGIPFAPVIDGELLPADGNILIDQGKYCHIPYMLGSNADDITTENQAVRSPETNRMHAGNVAFAKKVNKEADSAAYVYYFQRKMPGDDSGAFHSAELWYVFGSLEFCWRPLTEADRRLSQKMIACWSNFMKSGNPNGPGEKGWRPCTEEDPYFEVLDADET